MGLTIGNVDLGDRAHANWSDSPGGEHTVTGFLRKSSVGAFLVASSQVVGLLDNPDEDAVAVVATQDPSRPGFYRVTGGSLDIDAAAMMSFAAPLKLELEAVPGRFSPRIESRIYGALRSNSHAIAIGTTVPWWACPDAASMDFAGVGGSYGTPALSTRTSDTGALALQSSGIGEHFYDKTMIWQCDPTYYYVGAAAIEITPDSGTTWVRLPGRRIGAATAASSTGWRLNNGLVRVSYGGGTGLISVQHYMGGSWITAKTYRVHASAGTTVGSAVGAVKSVTILRNAPECATIRVGMEYSSTYPAVMNLDLTLRRGSLWVDGVLTVTTPLVNILTAGALTLGVGRNTAEASTTHTSGLHATAADAAGGKYILTSSVTVGKDHTQGAMWASTAATSFPFMIGYEHSGASGINTFTNQVYSWFAAANESTRFARR